MKQKIYEYLLKHHKKDINSILVDLNLSEEQLNSALKQLLKEGLIKENNGNIRAIKIQPENKDLSKLGEYEHDYLIEETRQWSDRYDDEEISDENFENHCMYLIWNIVSIKIDLTRTDAIDIAKTLLEKAKLSENKTVVDVYTRVLNEFKIATDEEYNDLKKTIFK